MKIKPIILSIATACYAAGVAASTNSTSVSSDTLRTIDLMEHYQLQKQLKTQVKDQFLSPLRKGPMSNIHFQPRHAADKFIAEDGLSGTHTYIVRLHDNSVATYQGSTAGLKATRARGKLYSKGQLVGTNTDAVEKYTAHLIGKQEQVIQKASSKGVDIKVRHQFTKAINAFSTELTQEQAQKLAELPEIAFIQRSKMYDLHTDIGPEHIGATGVWDGSGLVDGGQYQGEGMIVGIIDTGVNTDHPSFADVGGDGYDHTNPLGEGNYLGGCADPEFADRCNDKLIGVYTHSDVTASYNGLAPEFGEDFEGHGSHVASTVAGNVLYDVDVVGSELGGGDGTPIGVQMPRVSGVAPHANIISYQVCIQGQGCSGEAMIFAIEQAIEDGVDAINMSIGGAESFPWDDAFEMAFLSAREAGIAVALSAGNSGEAYGPDSGYTVDHTSPWVLNVAATTHARSIDIDGKSLSGLTGGDAALIPADIVGAGISTEFTGEFVLAADFGDARCNTPFAPGTFTASQIVVCERGDIPRVHKASNAAAGGAGAFVLYNTWTEGDDIVDDSYSIPGIHITAEHFYGDWNTPGLQPWLASGSGLTGTITASIASRNVDEEDADWLANFSSRGPSSTVDEIFSPGIAAPGVDIFAAWNDENPLNDLADTRDWNAISGTSMASPHVAGMMALIRQAHPDWTASQIQSALQMTADSQAIKMTHPLYGDTIVAGAYRSGHGLANVGRAIDAGLVMDETADNFRRANPRNGGQVRDLNLPQLINNDCGLSCNWVRIVTATRDGTWNVNVEMLEKDRIYDNWILDPSSKITVTPSTFSLKAGESITLTVNSTFTESDMAWYDGTIQRQQGEIQFIAEDATIPSSQWPFSATYQGKVLPNTLKITANDDQGSQTVSDVPFGVPSSTLNAVAYTPVEATTREVDLPRMGFGVSLTDASGFLNLDHNWVTVTDLTVPADSALLHVEILDRVKTEGGDVDFDVYTNADLLIMRDYNNDGILHYSEAICGSQLGITSIGEFCSLENPEAGNYKIVVYSGYPLFPWDAIDTFEVATAVVPKTVSNDITFNFSETAEEPLNSDMLINWNTSLTQGKTYYTVAAFQAGDNAEGSLAHVPLVIKRGANTVSVAASQDAARVGDIIDVKMLVQANKSGTDRAVELESILSDGLKIIPDSLRTLEGLSETQNGFTYVNSQVDSSAWKTNYTVTTNLEDESCKTPWDISYNDGTPINGQYVDLSKFGFAPTFGTFFEVNEWGWGNWVHDMMLPTIYGELTAFDNEDYFKTSQIAISSRGWAQLDAVQYNPWDFVPQLFHFEMPFSDYTTPPDYVFAPFWNAENDMMTGQQEWTLSKYEPHWDPEQTRGMSVAYYDGYTMVEWDNAQTHDSYWDMATFQTVVEPRDDNYDFEMFLREGTSYEAGKYEVVMAYDNIDFATQDGSGSIGLRGYHGPRDVYWPLYGHAGVSFAYNDLDSKITDDLIVCYDVVSAESSRVEVAFQVEVTPAALGVAQSVSVEGSVEGITNVPAFVNIEVASNITLTDISDQSIDENTTLEGISVNYADSDGGISVNTISVTGDNISATINGHESGSTIDITPDENFHGETLVTVTVADNIFANDKASTSFMLTVNSDGVEFGCTDSTALNYDANANQDNGSCTFPAEEETQSTSSSGGGAINLFVLLLAMFGGLAIRKRK